MKKSGAIIIGKTNTPEFGLGSQTYNSVFGTTFNAYDQKKTAGGSSGGAAVSVALRMQSSRLMQTSTGRRKSMERKWILITVGWRSVFLRR
jgi:Amidase